MTLKFFPNTGEYFTCTGRITIPSPLFLPLIVKVVLDNKLPMEEVPDLIIFSDMQFNQVSHNMNTQLQQVQKLFHDVGLAIGGKPYPAPKIVFWNLRDDTVGFPAQATTNNVQMLSGFSPALLKFVMEGEMVEEEVVDAQGNVTKVKVEPNPYETLRKVLDDERYDPVRKVWRENV